MGVHWYLNVPINFFTADVSIVGSVHYLAGFQSQIGLFLWSATTAICFFSGYLVKDKLHTNFLISAAIITSILGFDDAFLIHEALFPSLGLHELILLICYATVVSAFILKYYKVIMKSDYLLLAFAFFFFAVSVFIDHIFTGASKYVSDFGEDGAKFIGIITWLVYFTRTSKTLLSYND